MNMTTNKKQYGIIFAVTALAVLVYLACHKFDISQPIALDKDKAIDNFVRIYAVEGGKWHTGGAVVNCEFNIQNLIMLLLAKICGNIWPGINIYYIVTFFMISFSMYYFLSKMGITFAVSAGLSVLAAFLPFHTDRGEGQMMTSNFFLAPLFLSMFYDLAYCGRADSRPGRYMLLACLSPFIDIRISIMAALLMIVFIIQRADFGFARRMSKYLIPLAALSGVVGLASSTLKASDMQTANEEGMRILDLVMPMRYHVVGFLSNRRWEYDVMLSANGESGLNSMGILFSMGFACMMAGLFFEWKKDRRIAWLGMIGMIVILVSGIRGIGSVIEYFGIRVTYWNRMAVFIIAGSATASGMLIDKGYRYIKNRHGKNVLAAAAVIMYALFALEFMELVLRQNM